MEFSQTGGQELHKRELNPTEQAFVSRMVSFYEEVAKEVGLMGEDAALITDGTRGFVESKIRSGEIEVKESTEDIVRPEA